MTRVSHQELAVSQRSVTVASSHPIPPHPRDERDGAHRPPRPLLLRRADAARRRRRARVCVCARVTVTTSILLAAATTTRPTTPDTTPHLPRRTRQVRAAYDVGGVSSSRACCGSRGASRSRLSTAPATEKRRRPLRATREHAVGAADLGGGEEGGEEGGELRGGGGGGGGGGGDAARRDRVVAFVRDPYDRFESAVFATRASRAPACAGYVVRGGEATPASFATRSW